MGSILSWLLYMLRPLEEGQLRLAPLVHIDLLTVQCSPRGFAHYSRQTDMTMGSTRVFFYTVLLWRESDSPISFR